MLQPGQTIGAYRIDALLGKGAMGEVYQGEQLSLGRPVAIKRIADHLLDEPDAMSRFELEARCVAALGDPHIIAVYDFGLFTDADGEGQVLLIMELVPGGRSLKRLLSPDEPLAWQEATALVQQIARGLTTAHEQGVVHRDVKPDNVLLSVKGIAKLADFGLARGAESTALTAAGNMLGTPNYMSPEACQGEPVGSAADIYSLGASWYHLLAGRPPFTAQSLMALVTAHCERQPEPIAGLVPQLPVRLAELVHRCLEKDPAARPSADEVVAGIAASGAQLPDDLRDLCRRGGMSTDPSTVGTNRADPTAATVRDGATAATAVPDEAGTAATAVPENDTLPTACCPPAGEDEVPGHRPLPTWLFVPLMLLVVGLVISWLFFGGDPLEQTEATIDELLAGGQLATALTTADVFVELYPSQPGGHELVRRVVAQEARTLALEGRYDDALARLEERRSGREWLDTALMRRDVILMRAAEALQNGQIRHGEQLYLGLMQELPRDVHTREEILRHLDGHQGQVGWHCLQRAALDLLELQPAAARDRRVYEVLLGALFRRNVNDETTDAVRAVLLEHHRDATLRRAREALDHERDEARRHAVALLRLAGELEPRVELQHHLRNLTQLSGSMREPLREATAYIREQAEAADWHQRLAAAGYGAIEEIRSLDGWSSFHDGLIEVCALGLAEELRPWALAQAALRGDEARSAWRPRWNAYRFLEATDALERIDLPAYHATTLVSFEPWYEPVCFTVARDFFAGRLDGEHAGEARAALVAGRQYILAVRERVVANDHPTDTIDTNLASLEVLLERQ